MSKATIQLSPSLLGAWALISIARDRQSGVLKCIFSGKEAHLLFAKGRLIGLRDAAGNETREPQKARGAARVFSLANDGNSTFLEDSRLAENGGGVDTLGDVLVALTRYTPEPVLDAFWTAHAKNGWRPKRASINL
ncbi:hypothetical protein KAI87_08450 [Myxococcota bacterium]|nr:hypothetical protein [Myxococcota bacterium]